MLVVNAGVNITANNIYIYKKNQRNKFIYQKYLLYATGVLLDIY